ncbi:uncharacterized protein KY384_004611 [Bacidia gigantensis]|uniref:uncharacterized protein n=1 Tax=Bacidia gigantensis TaxID=2732470 RepID=UPI001D03C310|nr:uncharacterized protein KY384_004611 [Bacidia gigantensis]KAG8531253.1 hypothetical protein KY384_004611 [Bacidia gigantensis]
MPDHPGNHARFLPRKPRGGADFKPAAIKVLSTVSQSEEQSSEESLGLLSSWGKGKRRAMVAPPVIIRRLQMDKALALAVVVTSKRSAKTSSLDSKWWQPIRTIKRRMKRNSTRKSRLSVIGEPRANGRLRSGNAKENSPTVQVKETENGLEESLNSSKGTNTREPEFPVRPGFGTKGSMVTVLANLFEMMLKDTEKDLVLHPYKITVVPPPKGKRLASLIIELLLDRAPYKDFRDCIVTDKRQTLISSKKLQDPKEEEKFIVKRGKEIQTQEQWSTTYTAKVTVETELPLSLLIHYLKSSDINEVLVLDKNLYLHALNIFLSHYAKHESTMYTTGNRCYAQKSISDENMSKGLGAGLKAVRGFFSSVRLATARILVNVNVSHIAVYNEGSLSRLIQDFGSDSMSNLNTFLFGLKVRTMHSDGNDKIPKKSSILGLASKDDGNKLDNPPQVSKFGAGSRDVKFHRGNCYVSVFEYFHQREYSSGLLYKILIFLAEYPGRHRNTEDPVVNVGTKEKPTYLPADVCQVEPGQPCRMKLDPTQTQKMIEFTVRRPWKNADYITGPGVKQVGLERKENPALKNFNLKVTNKLILVQSRTLQPPKLIYKNQNHSPQDGSWNLADFKMNSAMRLGDWAVFLITKAGKTDFTKTDDFVAAYKKLMVEMRKIGMTIEKAPGQIMAQVSKGIELPNDDQRQKVDRKNRDDLASVLSKPGFKFFFVCLPDEDKAIYNHVKRLADIHFGVHTVCAVAKKFWPSGPQYQANLAMKFNFKLGGINQLVDNAKLGFISKGSTMVVGLDVTHPSPGSCVNAPSIAAIVASYDIYLSQFPGKLAIQEKSKGEMISGLQDLMISRLLLWRKKNKNTLPENILVYRDGVSEGQYQKVLDEELILMRKAFKAEYDKGNKNTTKNDTYPRVTIVIVGKRHHLRFYPKDLTEAAKNSNLKPGTVIDRGVTEARNWEFYLQPHSALQGTARTSHYYVIYDQIFHHHRLSKSAQYENQADMLEGITHAMCYLFPRATKAISVCPPAYLADLLCERGRVYLERLYDPQPWVNRTNERAAEQKEITVHDRLKDTCFIFEVVGCDTHHGMLQQLQQVSETLVIDSGCLTRHASWNCGWIDISGWAGKIEKGGIREREWRKKERERRRGELKRDEGDGRDGKGEGGRDKKDGGGGRTGEEKEEEGKEGEGEGDDGSGVKVGRDKK